MAEFDPQTLKLTLKIVYYGPSLSGKTTNLLSLHEQLLTPSKGQLMVLETQNDRTLFFDLFPLGFRAPSGLLIKFKIYTVPGQVAHDSTRKAVLSRTDGVVFVADSRKTQTVNNGESFENLADNAARVGLDFQHLPLVVQFNKRDLPDVLSETEIHDRWATAPWPLTFASALQGQGVIETFSVLLAQLFPRLDAEFALQADHGLDSDQFIAGAVGSAA
ncbi:GTP-binding protein [Andreprevotia chitinilytica]|uniref:GTP-binding protein n=1 Tax=Andreprevotia chitinilytica TaxID=396808 RepID=UPI000558B725|nr:GTPase domain-containing protein [Andreprevotia chitinilytica]